ncbi:hypothetical protein C5C44_02665 [Rathayibacter sp. AY1F6]|nr:hypothetical protein C5C39_05900 [Rathayibacter sp. AY1F3]PPH05653.1 hypothetical protein C5C44_02665 [Rathayibacter sp. AY1F6]
MRYYFEEIGIPDTAWMLASDPDTKTAIAAFVHKAELQMMVRDRRQPFRPHLFASSSSTVG